MVERPEAVDEGPEAWGEVDGVREATGEFGGSVLEGREVFEEVVQQAVFVVEGCCGRYDAVVEVVQGLAGCGWVQFLSYISQLV